MGVALTPFNPREAGKRPVVLARASLGWPDAAHLLSSIGRAHHLVVTVTSLVLLIALLSDSVVSRWKLASACWGGHLMV